MSNKGATSLYTKASEKKLERNAGVAAIQHFFQTQYRTSQPHSDPRFSPQVTLSVDEALRIIINQSPEPIAVDSSVTTSIIGSVIANDVHASRMIPSSHVSAIDGYAIVVEQDESTRCVFPKTLALSSKIDEYSGVLRSDTAVRITTGAPLPRNANAVVSMEDTILDERGGESVGIITNDITIGKSVREPGSHIPLHSRLFACGDTLSPVSGAISLLALAGVSTVKIFKKPRVGILRRSENLVDLNMQMCEASHLSVLSGLASWGVEIVDLGTVHGTSDEWLYHALHANVDIILITNGQSIELDLKSTIESTLGGAIHFNRVAIKPSSHTMFATIPIPATENVSRPIFSLPSDPASALVALNIFVLPSLNKMSGLGESAHAVAAEPWMTTQLGLPRVAVVLTHHFPLDPRQTEYHLAVVTGSRSDARLYATSIGSGALESRRSRDLKRNDANALIILRVGRGVGIKGEIVEALLMGPIHGSDTRLIC
ncbi:MoeA C-terminal domain IV [Penicillium angulare]|uniref:MoeA C-terminal domain IV n=1 Tax=Penicillium angulare TaxID=116970 RepID=UPI0025402963|nr:MoeA C-terminal domain IV [Penicillium angulare]KAJ5288170.1 MoeA C-terminal domain IV [Penicillium angulare]